MNNMNKLAAVLTTLFAGILILFLLTWLVSVGYAM